MAEYLSASAAAIGSADSIRACVRAAAAILDAPNPRCNISWSTLRALGAAHAGN